MKLGSLSKVVIAVVILSLSEAGSVPRTSIYNYATIGIGINYVAVILMENAGLNQSYNCVSGMCSYVHGFADNSSIAHNYYSKWCLSLANYLVLLGGSDFGYNQNCTFCDPASCGSLWPIASSNLVDRFEESGLTWKAYMEDYPGPGFGASYSTGGCYLGSSGEYRSWHNPFIYFQDIESDPGRCSRIVGANSLNTTTSPEVDDVFLSDLQSVSTSPNLMWLTPNNCDNMHDYCFGSDRFQQGDEYLSRLIPKILSSPVFQTRRAALFVTWDETESGEGQVAAIWSGSVIKDHYCDCSTAPLYNHASFPKTLEAIWHLQSLGQLDLTAPAMTEFFL